MNTDAILMHSYGFDVRGLSSKTTARQILRLGQTFLGNDQLVNQTPACFLLGIAKKLVNSGLTCRTRSSVSSKTIASGTLANTRSGRAFCRVRRSRGLAALL